MSESGFCFGVQKAVEKAYEQYKSKSAEKQIYLYGDLVNNSHVMQDFKDKGFLVSEDTNSIPSSSIVVIRTHGVPCSVMDVLISKNITIDDCTCTNVKKIHNLVTEKSNNNYKIIVVGKKTHPEVIGILGCCSSGSACVVGEEVDFDSLDLSGKVCVVVQTTFNRKKWEKLIGLMFEKNVSIEIHDTLCNVTSDREEKAKKIAESSDVMLVIGDQTSSNSRELYCQCRSVCENTFSINSLGTNDIKLQKLNDLCSLTYEENLFTNTLFDLENDETISKLLFNSTDIGLAASASTPANVISDVYNYLQFIDFLKVSKKEIENTSHEYFDEFISNAPDNSFVQDALKTMCEKNEGGKRIRGAMIKLGEQIASHGTNNNYLPIAVAYELFQTAVLIHDDIIDNSDMRRNKTTIHVESAKNIKEFRKDGISDFTAKHFGVSRAICIGDYGFFISYQFLSKCNINSLTLAKVYQLYSKILTITCEGETMDVVLPVVKVPILEKYEEYKHIVTQIYEYKTAWYTLAGPIMLGAVCGGADDDLVELLKDISIPLGIAFQIKDDILGIYSNEKVLGKPTYSDIRENKKTLLFGYAYKNANDQQRSLLTQHYGKDNADEQDLEIIRKLFEETGAKKYAENEIQRLSNIGKELICSDLIDKKYQSILYGLISYLIGRKF